MDRLVRILSKRKNQVLADDRKENYNPDKEYLIEEEILENGTVIVFYYEQDNI